MVLLAVNRISEKFVLNGRPGFTCALREVLLKEEEGEECGI